MLHRKALKRSTQDLQELFRFATSFLHINTQVEPDPANLKHYLRPFLRLDDSAPTGNPYRYLLAVTKPDASEAVFGSAVRLTALEMDAYLRGLMFGALLRSPYTNTRFPGLVDDPDEPEPSAGAA